MKQGEIANRFVMKGKDLDIAYETTSISGQPQLMYKSKRGGVNITFGAKKIRQSRTKIGQQVTVTIKEPTPDFGTVTLTLLLPTINLEGKETSFKTIAIVTTHRDSLGGPQMVKGALQTYQVEKLRGKATKVIFLKKP